MTKLKDLALDVEAAERGRWCHYDGSLHFRIARLGNQAYKRAASEAREDEDAAVIARSGGVTMDLIERRQTFAAGRALLTDWWGMDLDAEPVSPDTLGGAEPKQKIITKGRKVSVYVVGDACYRECSLEDGDPEKTVGLFQPVQPFEKDLAVEILKDPENVLLRDWVIAEASSWAMYRAKRLEADRGN